MKSDGESGDEEIINPDHLTRGQLTAPAELELSSSNETSASDTAHGELDNSRPLVSELLKYSRKQPRRDYSRGIDKYTIPTVGLRVRCYYEIQLKQPILFPCSYEYVH